MTEQEERRGRPVVGFIGLGDQGAPMAVAVAEAGFPLQVWARRPESLEALGSAPRSARGSAREVAASADVLALCVRTDQDVLDLLQRDLLDAMRPGTVLVNHGTGTPANARRIADLCRDRGIAALDAPVSGGGAAAAEHRITTWVGGEEAAFRRCRDVFDAFSTHVLRTGSTGTGQRTKILNNALLILNFASDVAVLDLAVADGVSRATTVVEALKLGSAFNNSLGYLNTMVDADTVDHLVEVLRDDLDVFEDAIQQEGLDASEIVARGRAGLTGLPALIDRMNEPTGRPDEATEGT